MPLLPDLCTDSPLAAQKVAAEACQQPVRKRGHIIAIVGPLLTGIALVFIVLRLIARKPWGVDKLFGWDDAFAVAAWISSVPLAVLDGFYCYYGLGQDIWRLPFGHINSLLKLFWAGEFGYLAATVLIKISLLAFFLRVFPNYAFRMTCKVMIGICVAFGLSFLFALTFQCSPLNYAWERWDGEHTGSCINIYVGGFLHAAINMVLDLIILLMPMPLLWKLQLSYSLRQRVQVLIMFYFGLVGTVISALRLSSLLTFGNTHNPSWDYLNLAVWSMTEIQTCIICACLPTAKVALSKVLPRWLGSTVKDSRGAVANDVKQASLGSSQPRNRDSKSTSTFNMSVQAMSPKREGFTELHELGRNPQHRERDEISRVTTPHSDDHGSEDFSKPLASRRR